MTSAERLRRWLDAPLLSQEVIDGWLQGFKNNHFNNRALFEVRTGRKSECHCEWCKERFGGNGAMA